MKNAAFEKLFKMYYNEAVLYVCSLTHNRTLAEDIVQEAFSKALTSIDDERDTFKYWLFKVSRNCYFDYLRKTKRLAPIDDKQRSDERELVQGIIEKEEYVALYDAISNLKENYREVVLLYYFDGLSVSEIGDITGQSTDNVKVLLFRARAKLKLLLEAKI